MNLHRVRRWVDGLRQWFMLRFRSAPVLAPPLPPVEPPAPVVSPPPADVTAELRRYERRRRKHDKFVKPVGEVTPIKIRVERQPRPKPQPKPEPPPSLPEEIDPKYIIDHHHEDTEDVLYMTSEMFGEFNFRDTILQQLDRYFVYLKRMKRHDRDSYDLYRQIGATLLPYVATGAYDMTRKDTDGLQPEDTPLSEWFNRTRPGFGCFAYGTNPETEKYELTAVCDDTGRHVMWVPKFMYYTKYKKPPPELQQMGGGDIYKLTVWWDRPHDPKFKRKYGIPQQFGIYISQDGKQIVALRQIDTKLVPVRPKRGADRQTFHVPQRSWKFPDGFTDWAKTAGKSVQELMLGLFLVSVQKQDFARRSAIRVAASKGNMTAVFGVNIERTAYFFQDRDIHLNDRGSRKRIFHVVRAHTRRDGTEVKLHYRGEREFDWAGYKILITVPGRDHKDITECDIGCVDGYWMVKGEKYLSVPEVGKLLVDSMKHELQTHSRAP